jgi:hypothetical protein
MPDELEPMYTEVEAARRLGIKPRSLRTERENGRIKFKKIACIPYYSLQDLVEWQSSDTIHGDASFATTGFIYFVPEPGTGAIKIGYASDVQKRVDGLQTAHPQRLELIGFVPGGFQMERAVHQAVRPHHIRGEWHRPDPKLFSFIAEVLRRAAEWSRP